VSRRTAYRWLRREEIQAALTVAQDECLRGLARQLIAAASKSITLLEATLDDETQPGYVRVASAKAILDNALRLWEVACLSQRVEALEQELTEC
jgi:hypothetical protein